MQVPLPVTCSLHELKKTHHLSHTHHNHLYKGYLLLQELNSPSCFFYIQCIHCIKPLFMCLNCIFSVSASFCKTIMQIRKHHSGDHIIPVELLDDTRLHGYQVMVIAIYNLQNSDITIDIRFNPYLI